MKSNLALFLFLFIDRHLGCFYLWVIVNNATYNMGVHTSLNPCFQSFWIYIHPEVESVDHMVILLSIFWGTTHKYIVFCNGLFLANNLHISISVICFIFSNTCIIPYQYPVILEMTPTLHPLVTTLALLLT